MNDSHSASQRPNVLHLPPDVTDFELGDIAVEFAADVGLKLYDWQAWALRNILARRTDGNWAARDSCLEVPRQNGKNAVLEALELALVFLLGARLVIHSAHRVDTSAEHFIRMRSLIESSPDLMDQMPKTPNRGFVTANGKEAIHLADGARILFKTRSRTMGRGPSPDAIVFDEAMELPKEAVGSMTPALSAREKALLVFTSSSPMATSDQLWRLRRRALNGDGGRLFYAGWNSDPDVDPADEANWFACNPSLGFRKNVEAMRADRDLMDPAEFAREHLGIPEDPVAGSTVIPLEQWDGLHDEASQMSGRVLVALDVSPDRKWATFAAAGRRDDGLVHVEMIERRPGTSWVVEYAKSVGYLRETGLRVEKGGPAASLIAPLVEAGVEVEEVSTDDLKRATGLFIDAALAGELRHLGGQSLRSAVSAAQLRASGDAELWSRRSSKMDITPLVAATIALGGVPEAGEVPKQPLYVGVS